MRIDTWINNALITIDTEDTWIDTFTYWDARVPTEIAEHIATETVTILRETLHTDQPHSTRITAPKPRGRWSRPWLSWSQEPRAYTVRCLRVATRDDGTPDLGRYELEGFQAYPTLDDGLRIVYGIFTTTGMRLTPR